MELALLSCAALLVVGAAVWAARRVQQQRQLRDPEVRARVLGDALARARAKQEGLGMVDRHVHAPRCERMGDTSSAEHKGG